MTVLIITMPSASELRAELKALRAENGNKPLSKMRKSDISDEINRLAMLRETTPAVASFPIKSHEMPKNIRLAPSGPQEKPKEPKPRAKKNPIIPLESGEMSEVNYQPMAQRKSAPAPKPTAVGKMVQKKQNVESLADAIRKAFSD
jgi:hypothetical protein